MPQICLQSWRNVEKNFHKNQKNIIRSSNKGIRTRFV